MMEIHEIDITDGLNKAMFEKLEEENKMLKERLADADKALKAMDEKYGLHYLLPDDKGDATVKGNSPAWKYMLKWGVK